MVKIKEIPLNDRPRERLVNQGSQSLSNEELLSIIISSGTKTESAKEIANKLLSTFNNIQELKEINYSTLIKIKGIGSSKATKLLATIELAKRFNTKVETINNLKVKKSSIVFEYYKDKIGSEKQEYFYCLYLNNQKRIIKDKLLYIGTINKTIIHPREIFKEAYTLSATAIICVHNHPGGNVIPSKEDITMTNSLKQIGILMGIDIIDHLIISDKTYYSFYENGDI